MFSLDTFKKKSLQLNVFIHIFADCHFTCHQNCGALVRLGCKSKSSPDLAANQSLEQLLPEPTDTLQTVSSDGSSEPTNVRKHADMDICCSKIYFTKSVYRMN